MTEDGCDLEDGAHVTPGSRDDGREGECWSVTLEGVAGPQQVGRRFELVVQSAASTLDGRCVRDTNADEHDTFSIEVVPGIVYVSWLSS